MIFALHIVVTLSTSICIPLILTTINTHRLQRQKKKKTPPPTHKKKKHAFQALHFVYLVVGVCVEGCQHLGERGHTEFPLQTSLLYSQTNKPKDKQTYLCFMLQCKTFDGYETVGLCVTNHYPPTFLTILEEKKIKSLLVNLIPVYSY